MTASSSLDALYQQVILEHNRHPVGFDQLDNASLIAQGYNPVCGDHIQLGLFLDAGGRHLQKLGFDGQSCAICTASASLLCQQLHDLSIDELKILVNSFLGFIKHATPLQEPSLQPLQVFAELQRLPTRQGCAALPWETLQTTLQEFEVKHE